jgi:hypothetical protein
MIRHQVMMMVRGSQTQPFFRRIVFPGIFGGPQKNLSMAASHWQAGSKKNATSNQQLIGSEICTAF